jgi:hypothetical protein
MHGIEHRVTDRRALRLSAPRKPLWATPASMLPDAPQLLSATEPFARNGLLLARNGRRLSRRPFQGQSSWPATSLPCQLVSLPVRFFGSTTLGTVCPAPGCFPASNPSPALPAGFSGRFVRLHSPSGLYSPSDRSVQRMPLPSGSPSESARSPFAPRRLFYC